MAFTTGTSQLKKNYYRVFVKSEAGTDFANYTEVGACDAGGSMGEEKGDEQGLMIGKKLVVNKDANVDFTVLEVTKANVEALRTLVNKDTTVVFTQQANFTKPTEDDWVIKNVNVFPTLKINSNALNRVEMSGVREIPADDITTIAPGA